MNIFHALIENIIMELKRNNGAKAKLCARSLKFKMWESSLSELARDDHYRNLLDQARELAKAKSGTTYMELSNIVHLIDRELEKN
jgi:hypothetical protein